MAAVALKVASVVPDNGVLDRLNTGSILPSKMFSRLKCFSKIIESSHKDLVLNDYFLSKLFPCIIKVSLYSLML